MANANPGKDAGQGGLGPALVGQSEIRQASTTFDAITLTGAGAGANLLNLRLTAPTGSTGDSPSRFVVNSSGEVLTHYRNVYALSSAATTTVGSSLSGSILTVPTSSAAKTLTLPAPVPGMTFLVDASLGAGIVGPTIVTSVGSTGSWRAVGDAATDGVTLSTTVTLASVLQCIAVSSTKWVAQELLNGSTVGKSSATAWVAVSS